jgi:hypothetical protein
MFQKYPNKKFDENLPGDSLTLSDGHTGGRACLIVALHTCYAEAHKKVSGI